MSEAMPERQLEKIEKRAEAATAGPWEYVEVRGNPVLAHDLVRRGQYAIGPHIAKFYKWDGQGNRDALFCVHARRDIPKLLKEVRRSHAENAELRKQAESAHLDAQNEQTRASDLEAENAELRERVEELENALSQYAEESNWGVDERGLETYFMPMPEEEMPYDFEGSSLARAVLSPKQEEEEG